MWSSRCGAVAGGRPNRPHFQNPTGAVVPKTVDFLPSGMARVGLIRSPPHALSPALPFGAAMASYEDVMSLSVRRGFLWPAAVLFGGFGGFYIIVNNVVPFQTR